MLGSHLENFQELSVPKNGQKQPKKAQISQNLEKWGEMRLWREF